MKKKNILMIALSLCLVAVIAVGGTLAYFTDTTDTSDNVFVTGNVNISLTDKTEEGGKGAPLVDNNGKEVGIQYTNVLPGDTLKKYVSLSVLDSDVKTGRPASSNAHVGILVTIKAYGDAPTEKEVLQLVDEAVARQEKADNVDTWLDKQEVLYWEDGEPVKGYLYAYNPAVAGRSSGVPAGSELKLFSDIKIPTAWDNAYASSTFDIMVKGFAIQADNLSNTQLASAIQGMLRDSKGDAIEFEQVED